MGQEVAKPGILNSPLRSEKRAIKTQTQILRFSEDGQESDTCKWLTIKNSTSFYDKEGRIIRDEIYRRNGSVEVLYQYEYNTKGKLEFLRMNGNDIRYYYDTKDSIEKTETYDKDGNLEEITKYSYIKNGNSSHPETRADSNIQVTVIYNFFDKNDRLATTEHSDEGIIYKTSYYYDDAGNKILEKSFENNDLVESHKYVYKLGKISREEIDGESKTIKTYDDKEQLVKSISGNTEQYFKYDNAGRLVSTFDFYDNKLREIIRYTFEYYQKQ